MFFICEMVVATQRRSFLDGTSVYCKHLAPILLLCIWAQFYYASCSAKEDMGPSHSRHSSYVCIVVLDERGKLEMINSIRSSRSCR